MATNNDVEGCVYFYKDTINTGKIKMSCIYEGVVKMCFTTLITYHFKTQTGQTENVERNWFSRKDKCCILINHSAKSVYYSYEDDFQQDFRSVPDFLRSCIDELSKVKIMIKMGALYETAYSSFCVNRLATELYGKWDYKVLKELTYFVE
jgi:hypothetical protein